MNGNLSMERSANKIRHDLQQEEECRISERRRNIHYLVLDYLKENGYTATSETLVMEASLPLTTQVCDNINLEMIVAEYENYYRMKFNKHPMLCKKDPTIGNVTEDKRKTKLPSKQKNDKSVKEKTAQQITNSDPANDVSLAMKVTPAFPSENRNGALSEDDVSPSKEQFTRSKILKCIGEMYPVTSELRQFAEEISNDIVMENLNIHWDDVKGLNKCKKDIKEAVVYPIKYPIFFKRQFTPWKGVLLYGPPGTGKTMLAKAVATECKCTFFNITASTLVSKWRGESEKYIRVLFELAYRYSPTIIFIDEIDWIAANLENTTLSEPAKRFRSELLARLDGLISTANSNVVLLATTNVPWNIDAALLRRLEMQIYVPLPDRVTRSNIFDFYLSECIMKNDQKVTKMLDLTQMYSCADIQLICKKAWTMQVTPIWKQLEEKQISVVDLKYEITNFNILLEVIQESKPTVTNINVYETWNEKK